MAEGEGAEVERQVCEALSAEELGPRLAALDLLYKEHSSQQMKEASRKERQEKEMEQQKSRDLSYGELGTQNLSKLLNQIKATPGQYGPLFKNEGVFLDLGSGAGKACLAAALLHPFKKVVGIETLDCLGDAASAVKERMGNAELLASLDPPLPEDLAKPEVEFMRGNFVDEFDDKIAPLAPELTMVLACATMFGEGQLQTMKKLADLMPDGAMFITITQGFPEQMVLDLDREPMQRKSDATKRALAKRGTVSEGAQVILAPARNDAKAWRKVSEQQLDLEWGTTQAYIFRKLSAPHCYVGDLCMAAPAPKKAEGEPIAEEGGEPKKVEPIQEEALEYKLSIYQAPTTVMNEAGEPKAVQLAIPLDDPFGTPIEMCRIEPITKQRLANFKEYYGKAAELAKKYEKTDATKEASGTWSEVALELRSDAGLLKYSAVEAPPPESKIQPTKEVELLGQRLLKHVEVLAREPWAAQYMVQEFPQVCREKDEEGTGSLPVDLVPVAWTAMKAKLIGVAEERLNKVNGYQFP